MSQNNKAMGFCGVAPPPFLAREWLIFLPHLYPYGGYLHGNPPQDIVWLALTPKLESHLAADFHYDGADYNSACRMEIGWNGRDRTCDKDVNSVLLYR